MEFADPDIRIQPPDNIRTEYLFRCSLFFSLRFSCPELRNDYFMYREDDPRRTNGDSSWNAQEKRMGRSIYGMMKHFIEKDHPEWPILYCGGSPPPPPTDLGGVLTETFKRLMAEAKKACGRHEGGAAEPNPFDREDTKTWFRLPYHDALMECLLIAGVLTGRCMTQFASENSKTKANLFEEATNAFEQTVLEGKENWGRLITEACRNGGDPFGTRGKISIDPNTGRLGVLIM